jgi:hypothetical protein
MTALLPEVYQYVTKKENYEALLEMFEDLEKAKPQLRMEFWNEVYKEVKEVSRLNWELCLDEDVATQYSKLGFWYAHPNEPYEVNAGVIYETLSGAVRYGAWFDARQFKKEVLTSAVNKYPTHQHEWKIDTKPFSFLQYQMTGDNFESSHGLRNILPEVRSDSVKKYTKTLIDAFDRLAPFVEEQVETLVKTSKR